MFLQDSCDVTKYKYRVQEYIQKYIQEYIQEYNFRVQRVHQEYISIEVHHEYISITKDVLLYIQGVSGKSGVFAPIILNKKKIH